jgi:hypothetical protein
MVVIRIRFLMYSFALFIICIFYINTLHAVLNSEKKRYRSIMQKSLLYRGFNTAAFLNGIANSCTHAGAVIAANNEQEKQQSACNLLASIFQTVAVMAEKNNKRCISSHSLLIDIILLAINLINTLSKEDKCRLLPYDCFYLRTIAILPSKKSQVLCLQQILDNGKSDVLLKEVGRLVATIVSDVADNLPSIFGAHLY